ncbi:hypothetical protein [Natrinema sp. HArc-T2]|uniref:hypothetical protein n=1 Tax=Natrinema sp. HArc-T2 TaxID=3242701 RepID=UPI00359D676F
MIQEARAFHQEGFLAYDKNESEVEELQLQIEQLEEFVTAFLTDRYQPFERLLNEITSSGVLVGVVKDAVEEQLFDLADQGKVEYKQGYGSRLASDLDDGQEVSA